MLNKKLLIKIIMLAITMISSRGMGTTALKISFEDLPSLVKEKNRNVKGASLSVQSGKARTGYFLRSYLPTLGITAGGESFRSGELGGGARSQPFGGIETKLNIFKGGRDSLEEAIRKNQLKASQMEEQKIYFEELTKARKIYWELVFQQEVRNIFKEASELNEKNKKASEKRIQAGLATITDRIEFEINKIQLEQDLNEAELRYFNLQRELDAVLGLSQDTKLETVEMAPHQHDEELLALKADFNSHREIVQLKEAQSAFEFQKKQFYRWWTPMVDGYAGYFLYTQRERDAATQSARYEIVGGIKVTLELFDGFQSKAEGAAAGLHAKALENVSLQRQKELEAHFEAMKSELKIIHKLVHIGEKNLKLGKLYFDRTLGEYKRGVKNSPDVLSATQKYIEYKERYSKLRKDYHLARTDLLAMIGQ